MLLLMAVDTNNATYTAKNVKFKSSGVDNEIVSNDSIGDVFVQFGQIFGL